MAKINAGKPTFSINGDNSVKNSIIFLFFGKTEAAALTATKIYLKRGYVYSNYNFVEYTLSNDIVKLKVMTLSFETASNHSL